MMQNKFSNSNLLDSVLFSNISDSPVLISSSESITYRELSWLIFKFSAYLQNSGIKKGDRVIIQIPNSAEYIVAFMSVIFIGAIAVPIDSDCGPERLQYAKDQTQARIVINKKMVNVSDKTPCETTIPVQANMEDPAVIIFSSGSTGRPKGVVLKGRHLLVTANNLAQLAGLNQGHRELLLSPMCHTDGWQRVAATLLVKGCIVIYEGILTVPYFEKAVEDFQIDGFYSPPPFIRYLLTGQNSELKKAVLNCKSIEVGSAPVSEPELTMLLDLFPNAKILVHFGLTESSRATAFDCREYPDKLHTVGKALNGVTIKIDESGEILLRGEQCTEQYWNRPDLNTSMFSQGWLKTGDFGSLDNDGFLTYRGRKDHMINAGGFHFFPNEVELELGPIPGLKNYLVAGIADNTGIAGEIPILFAVPTDSTKWSRQDFFEFAKKRLSPFKIPKKIILVPQILTTASGKPDRAKMISIYGASDANKIK